MAAFHTNVLRNGEWVTEVVDANTALKASIDAKPKDGAKNFETSPFGILSRTIVHNPKVNLILPACLRSKDHNDIAFIGVSLPSTAATYQARAGKSVADACLFMLLIKVVYGVDHGNTTTCISS